MSNWPAAGRAALVAIGAAAVGALAFAAPASAHVSVIPAGEAVQGKGAELRFRVPNESGSASTTKVEVVMPPDAPLASVSTMPVPGWTVSVQRRKLDKPVEAQGRQVIELVTSITWTVTGDTGIKPEQVQEFWISITPLPRVDKMVFKTLQTYSDGTIARWIEEPGPDGKEPENPAPILKLLPASGAAASPSADPAGAAGNSHDDGDGDDGESDGLAVGLAVAGLAAGRRDL